MLSKEQLYKQGNIIKDKGQYYIIAMYKGLFVCGDVDTFTHLEDWNINNDADFANSLSELSEMLWTRDDRLVTTVQSNHIKELKEFKIGEITRDNSMNKYILWQKPKGKKVWVPLEALKNHDLNELLHIKWNRHENWVERTPNKELPVIEFVALTE